MNTRKIINVLAVAIISVGIFLSLSVLVFNNIMPVTAGSLIYLAIAMIILGLVAFLFSKLNFFNRTMTGIFLMLCSFVLTITIIESIFYCLILLGDNNARVSARFMPETEFPRTDFYVHSWELGYFARPNSSTIYRTNEYNSTISTDAFGRRISPDLGSKPSIILFGDSYAFGDGLEDNETLAYFLSGDAELNVYNYAFQGYGTQGMLANLEREGFSNEIKMQPVAAIYVYISDHIKRVIGDMRTFNEWGNDMPYYYLSGSAVKREESFETGRRFISFIYRMLGKSYLLKYYYLSLPPISKSHVYLTYKLIEKSRDIYESQFDGTFYVLIHPSEDINQWNNRYLIDLLKKAKIEVMTYDLPYNSTFYFKDGHPKTPLNIALAKQISSTLRKQKER